MCHLLPNTTGQGLVSASEVRHSFSKVRKQNKNQIFGE